MSNNKYPIGYKFNKLTILKFVGKIKNTPHNYYQCKCDCGNIVYVRSQNINKQKSCGCERIKHLNYPMGYTFNNLTILEFLGIMDKYGKSYYKYICNCGKTVSIPSNRINIQKSCGCTKDITPFKINIFYKK